MKPDSEDLTESGQSNLDRHFLLQIQERINFLSYKQKWKTKADLENCSKKDIDDRRKYLNDFNQFKIGPLFSELKREHESSSISQNAYERARKKLGKIVSAIEQEFVLSRLSKQQFGRNSEQK